MDIKRQENEKVMLALRERELNLWVQEQEHADAEKNELALSWSYS